MTPVFAQLWPFNDRRGILWGWVAVLASMLAISAVTERQALLEELQTEAGILHRVASQRADQHDAHLTSLSALAVAGEDARQDLFLDVAATISRFYPRIEAVDLVSLNDAAAHLTTRTVIPDELDTLIRSAALSSNGQLALDAAPDANGRYLLVKRSPNTDDARFGLSLQIDSAELLVSDSAFWARPSVSQTLRLPDGTALLGDGGVSGSRFTKALGSASQPLVFEAGISPGVSDLLPPGRTFTIAGIVTSLYLIATLGIRQFMRTRRAETQARLSAQEARLAHASRINALGEMASGISHELTQPLTAILSQAQAGRHIAARGDAAELEPVFTSIAGQAKRASAILERLRNWSRPGSGEAGPISVNEAIRGVGLLLRADAERAGIALSADPGTRSMMVEADPVELEQVIFNLARNAMDAVSESAERRVTISARRESGTIVIEVSDSGPGVQDAIKPRLFEPFVTGRPDGTGLGLALCQRLADRMSGEISLVEDRADTVFRLSLPEAGFGLKEAAE